MKLITKNELQDKIANKENFFLIDVREPHEHQEFNLGGILLPIGKIQQFDLETIEHLKTEPVICYCRSGQRSAMGCMILEQIGFKNVSNLVGCVLEWQNK